MSDFLADIARAIAESRAHDVVVHLLSNVPGLPPLVQTVHLLAIATVMGSIVVICLKMLGLALPSQSNEELVRRLLPWLGGRCPCCSCPASCSSSRARGDIPPTRCSD